MSIAFDKLKLKYLKNYGLPVWCISESISLPKYSLTGVITWLQTHIINTRGREIGDTKKTGEDERDDRKSCGVADRLKRLQEYKLYYKRTYRGLKYVLSKITMFINSHM